MLVQSRRFLRREVSGLAPNLLHLKSAEPKMLLMPKIRSSLRLNRSMNTKMVKLKRVRKRLILKIGLHLSHRLSPKPILAR